MFSETTLGFLASGALGVLLSLRRKCFGWPGLVAAFIALGWLVVPYQQSRFLFVAWGVLTLAMASGARGLTDRFQAVLLVPAIAGGVLQAPTTTRLLVALAWTAGVTLEALRYQAGRPTPPATDVAPDVGRLPRSLSIAALLAVATGGVLAWGRAHPGAPAYAMGDAHDQGWTYARLHLRGLRIAYTGSNLPLPLWGPTLSNHVRYVNIAGGLEMRPHDLPGQASSAFPVSAEPAPERAHPDRDAWLSNLQAARIDVLFVAALYPEVRPSMSHDEAGFPIERAWADAQPVRFRLVFENAGVRIYKVVNDAVSGSQPG